MLHCMDWAETLSERAVSARGNLVGLTSVPKGCTVHETGHEYDQSLHYVVAILGHPSIRGFARLKQLVSMSIK